MQNSTVHFEVSTGIAAGVILAQSDIAAWLAWDGKTIDRGPLEDLASRINIVYDYAAGEIYKISLDGVDLDQYVRDIEGDECDNAGVGFIVVDDDLVAEIISRLKVSDPVPVVLGRRDRDHVEVREVSAGCVKLAVIDKNDVLMGFAWAVAEPGSSNYTIPRVEVWSVNCNGLRSAGAVIGSCHRGREIGKHRADALKCRRGQPETIV